jgi:hypothetical protein
VSSDWVPGAVIGAIGAVTGVTSLSINVRDRRRFGRDITTKLRYEDGILRLRITNRSINPATILDWQVWTTNTAGRWIRDHVRHREGRTWIGKPTSMMVLAQGAGIGIKDERPLHLAARSSRDFTWQVEEGDLFGVWAYSVIENGLGQKRYSHPRSLVKDGRKSAWFLGYRDTWIDEDD